MTILQAATDDDIFVNLDTTSVFTTAWISINHICKMKPTFWVLSDVLSRKQKKQC